MPKAVLGSFLVAVINNHTMDACSASLVFRQENSSHAFAFQIGLRFPLDSIFSMDDSAGLTGPRENHYNL